MPGGNSSPEGGSGVDRAIGVAEADWAYTAAAGKPTRVVSHEPSAARTIALRETATTRHESSVLCSLELGGMPKDASIARIEPRAPLSSGRQ
jgi:hypothetical protein